jgi:iron complex outermembrane receptor protein
MKKYTLFICFSILFSWGLLAQQQIKGILTDASTGKPIEGAYVMVQGDKGFHTSNAEGEFYITLNGSGEKVIEISHISYIRKKIQLIIPFKGNTMAIPLEPSTIQINPIVVTATRSENMMLDIPAKVAYISAKQISLDPGKSLDDALQYSSGIYINRNFGILSSKSSVSARGLSSKDQSRMLVLVDGVPVNKTDGGGVNWNLFNKETIESMEILKGPGSALYGNNAMAGVISINTKKPTQAFQGSVGLEYGTYNTGIARLNLMGRTHKGGEKGLYWLFSGLWSKSDGYMTYPKVLRDSNPSNNYVNTYMYEIGSLAKIGYDINKNNSVEF